ncbi:hypothetical protein PFISCL1PPCAC_3032, partial [Pristionchus fissidentatus]
LSSRLHNAKLHLSMAAPNSTDSDSETLNASTFVAQDDRPGWTERLFDDVMMLLTKTRPSELTPSATEANGPPMSLFSTFSQMRN